MQVTGTIVHIFPTEQIKESFKKRSFVVSIQDGQYTQEVKMQVVQDKCSFLDQLKVGQEVTVDFSLQGKSYEKKDGSGRDWFTNISAWRISGVVDQPAAATEEVPF